MDFIFNIIFGGCSIMTIISHFKQWDVLFYVFGGIISFFVLGSIITGKVKSLFFIILFVFLCIEGYRETSSILDGLIQGSSIYMMTILAIEILEKLFFLLLGAFYALKERLKK
ncbi:MAG: hypothetical protein K5860_00580 [Bacteroidales bacterium]|nr:hypothetical protein [Bacteroidales bacterium]